MAATTKTRCSSGSPRTPGPASAKATAGKPRDPDPDWLSVAIEIERKFLLKPGAWTPRDAGTHIQQGYLSSQNGPTVRVRIEATKATLTVKGPTTGFSRSEF